jgi:hypothetical protein
LASCIDGHHYFPVTHRLSFVVRRPSSNALRGGRSVSMIFAAKNAKIAKVLGLGWFALLT